MSYPGHSLVGFLPLCRGVVSVFYSSSRLGNRRAHPKWVPLFSSHLFSARLQFLSFPFRVHFNFHFRVHFNDFSFCVSFSQSRPIGCFASDTFLLLTRVSTAIMTRITGKYRSLSYAFLPYLTYNLSLSLSLSHTHTHTHTNTHTELQISLSYTSLLFHRPLVDLCFYLQTSPTI